MERARLNHAEGRLYVSSKRDLRIILDRAWIDSGDALLVADCLIQIIGRSSKALDRILVETYLQQFPFGHPSFSRLIEALLQVASRAGSRWKQPAERWNLFDPTAGPATVGTALIDLDPRSVTEDSGLSGDLLSGGFSRVAWRNACAKVAESDDDSAPRRAKALVAAAEIIGDLPAEHAHYARALLKPWVERTPSPPMKRFIIGELTGRIGDPRLERNRWRGLSRELKVHYPDEDVARLFGRLHFWLIENAIHQFLDVVDHDADPDQWPYRKAFWLSYLKAGHVKDAWVAFGPAAADRARDLTESSKAPRRLYADLTGAPQPTQSVLLLKIDNLVIGDWSHTGACRFWTKDSEAGKRLTDAEGNWLSQYSAAHLKTLDVKHPRLRLSHRRSG
jgi:hypothetical protein